MLQYQDVLQKYRAFSVEKLKCTFKCRTLKVMSLERTSEPGPEFQREAGN